jgi:hypothetical protein
MRLPGGATRDGSQVAAFAVEVLTATVVATVARAVARPRRARVVRVVAGGPFW